MNDPLFPALLILRYMHIFGAIALMGSTIFMRFALHPSVQQLEGEAKANLPGLVRARWAKFVHLSIALLLISGLANLGLASRYQFTGVNYNMLAGIKFLLALPIFFFASVLAGKTKMARKFQANATFWMNVNLTLAVIMVLMGGFLRFADRQLKAPKVDSKVAQVVDQVQTSR